MSKNEIFHLVAHPTKEEMGRNVFNTFGEGESPYGTYIGMPVDADILRDGPENLLQEHLVVLHSIQRITGLGNHLLVGETDNGTPAVITITPFAESGYKGLIVLNPTIAE